MGERSYIGTSPGLAARCGLDTGNAFTVAVLDSVVPLRPHTDRHRSEHEADA